MKKIQEKSVYHQEVKLSLDFPAASLRQILWRITDGAINRQLHLVR